MNLFARAIQIGRQHEDNDYCWAIDDKLCGRGPAPFLAVTHSGGPSDPRLGIGRLRTDAEKEAEVRLERAEDTD